ncbi:MAG: hypothetical protein LBE59_00085 [Nevskiaceae bacterium]|jgi:glyoxylase-like metal-dependent hydrolase (beta-lactamase superfamily II)|nr:hypothetical protein [Nevskiaceae bacterium]
MNRRNGVWNSALLLAVTMAVAGTAAAQNVARPPDITGNWRLDNGEDPGQPPLADYLGIPFNEAGRFRADTTPESIWDTPENQCRPHSLPHQWRGVGGARILAEQDPLTRQVRAYHLQYMRSLDRPIFMDGRPHPPAWAPHTWNGFSTGEWQGQTLKVVTTHVKDGYLKRGGPQTSDMYSFTEYITRHDDILTVVQVVDDPVYLEEPYVLSITSTYDPTGGGPTMETCSGSASGQNGGNDRHRVPTFLPGQNTAIGEFITRENWIPLEPTRGTLKSTYPEYRTAVLNGKVDAAKVDALSVPVSKSVTDIAARVAAQSPKDGQVHVLPVQGNIFMLVADGVNITASVGPDGTAIVNTGAANMSDKVLAALDQIASSAVNPAGPNNCAGPFCPQAWGWSSPYINAVISSPPPLRGVRYVFNTSAAPEHVGGNEKLAAAGNVTRGGGTGFGGAIEGLGSRASVVSHVNVLDRLSNAEPALSEEALPSDTFTGDLYKLSEYVNGEAVILYDAPNAITDGDSIVFFRHSEVIAAGDLFSTISYPVIRVDEGGTIDGVIAGLNRILDLAVAEYRSQGGTWVVPGRGRLSDTADVAAYRNMLSVIRDRIQDMVKKGRTLEQVKAARPTLDYDGRYATAAAGDWTADRFIEAVYRNLKGKK